MSKTTPAIHNGFQPQQAASGAFVDQSSETFQTATVISVDPVSMTCDLLRTVGGVLHDVPVANTTGSVGSNGSSWGANLRGAVVYYTYMSGRPYILGTLPSPMTPVTKVSTGTTNTATGGSNELTYGASQDSGYSAGSSTEFSPDDKVFTADGGATLALMAEGAIMVKASPLAQFVLGGGMDFAKIIARELAIYSDFGVIKSAHGSSGRTGLIMEGGAAYGEEAMSGGGTPTVHMHLGDTPDASETRFGVRVNSTDGGNFGALSLGKDGNLIFATSKDSLTSVGQDNELRVSGDEYHEVVGKSVTEIGGNEEFRTMGRKDTVVGKDKKSSVGGNYQLEVNGTLQIGAGAIVLTSLSGGAGPCELKCTSFNITKA